MNSNQPLLIYNLKEILLEFTYATFDSKNIIDGSEIGAPMAAWLQKHYWNFSHNDLVALVVSDDASYTKEALLIFTTGIFHGVSGKGGVYINFTDILDWNYAGDILSIFTSNANYQIRTDQIDLLSIVLLMDACRTETAHLNYIKYPKNGYKSPPLLLSEQQLLKKNLKSYKKENSTSCRKIATTSRESELVLRCLEGQKTRGILELNNILELYHVNKI